MNIIYQSNESPYFNPFKYLKRDNKQPLPTENWRNITIVGKGGKDMITPDKQREIRARLKSASTNKHYQIPKMQRKNTQQTNALQKPQPKKGCCGSRQTQTKN